MYTNKNAEREHSNMAAAEAANSKEQGDKMPAHAHRQTTLVAHNIVSRKFSQTINYLHVRLQHALNLQEAGLGPQAHSRARGALKPQAASVVYLSWGLFWGGHPLMEFWIALSLHIHLDTEEQQTFSAGPFLSFHFDSPSL
jgi:hypothetical protein